MSKNTKPASVKGFDGYSAKQLAGNEGYQPPKKKGIAQPLTATGGYQPTKGVSTQQTGIKPPVKK